LRCVRKGPSSSAARPEARVRAETAGWTCKVWRRKCDRRGRMCDVLRVPAPPEICVCV
jgi:hypothetical protein